MGTLLKKLNVVKCVDSEEKARKLEEEGFVRVKSKASSGKKAAAPQKPDK